ncbi:unnamed protein product [Boreogadus saida]
MFDGSRGPRERFRVACLTAPPTVGRVGLNYSLKQRLKPAASVPPPSRNPLQDFSFINACPQICARFDCRSRAACVNLRSHRALELGEREREGGRDHQTPPGDLGEDPGSPVQRRGEDEMKALCCVKWMQDFLLALAGNLT